MSESDDAHVTLRSLRGRIEALEKERDARLDSPGLAAVGVSLGVAVMLLTAMTWATSPDGSATATLLDLVEDNGWHGTGTVLAVLLLGTGSIVVSMRAQPSRGWLRVLVCLAAAVVALVAAAGGLLPTGHTLLGNPADHSSGPARWLTLIAALALLLTHAARLGELRNRA